MQNSSREEEIKRRETEKLTFAGRKLIRLRWKKEDTLLGLSLEPNSAARRQKELAGTRPNANTLGQKNPKVSQIEQKKEAAKAGDKGGRPSALESTTSKPLGQKNPKGFQVEQKKEDNKATSQAAALIGGLSTSPAKGIAARKNGAKGGRHKQEPRPLNVQSKVLLKSG